MTDRAIIDEVRSRIDLVELVGAYVPLRRQGSSYVARCPFHDEKTPSFSVSPDRGLYFCFGCKASGDALRFYEHMEGVPFPEALRALAERAGVEVPETRDATQIAEDRRQRDVSERLHAVCESAAAYFEACLQSDPLSELARGALEERGVSPELVTQFRLGYAPARWDGLTEHLRAHRFSPADAEMAGLLLSGRGGGHYDRFRHRLMFPVFDRGGRVVAFSGRILPQSEEIPEGIVPADAGKYVNSPETPLYRKGELLYGLANARMSMRQSAEALVVEGNFDVVQMHQHGFSNTVAPLGTSFTEAQAKLLRRFAETVVLVFDGDEAGRKAARASHPVCAKAGLIARVGVLPPRLDPDSFLRSAQEGFGAEGMRARIETGPSIVEWLIHDARDSAGDNVPERVSALRRLAPVIAEVRDSIEREVYVKLAAKALYLDEPQVRMALREHQSQSARVARESPFNDDARKRPGLSHIASETDAPVESRQKVLANALEAVLVRPELLESEDAHALQGELGPDFAGLIEAARAQWREGQRLDGAALAELCPTEKSRVWVASRLVAGGEEDPAQQERWALQLRDSVSKLMRIQKLADSRALKLQGARAGTQGDPSQELARLQQKLEIERTLVRAKTGRSGQS
ncbi:MAG: DNA primase [Polyangiales bacterium]